MGKDYSARALLPFGLLRQRFSRWRSNHALVEASSFPAWAGIQLPDSFEKFTRLLKIGEEELPALRASPSIVACSSSLAGAQSNLGWLLIATRDRIFDCRFVCSFRTLWCGRLLQRCAFALRVVLRYTYLAGAQSGQLLPAWAE